MFHTLFDYQDQNIDNNYQIPKDKEQQSEKYPKDSIPHENYYGKGNKAYELYNKNNKNETNDINEKFEKTKNKINLYVYKNGYIINDGKFRDISIPEKPIYIWANDMALRRVFQNVLKNVIEHGGKFVCISLIEMNSVIEITFHNDILHDTDIDTARVFDRFYKSDIARSSLSTGLGLSIAKELLDKMNGDISANVNDNIFEIVIKLEK